MSSFANLPLPDTRFHPWIPARLRQNRIVALLVRLDSRWRMRCHLAELSDHALADIGLTRADVAAEIAKPLWRG